MTHITEKLNLREIEQKTLLNIDLILTALNIEYYQGRGRFFFPCPIHGSDNYSSLTIYDNSGNWLCFTKGCHKNHKRGIFGFVAAVKSCSFIEAATFCENVLNGEVELNTVRRSKISIDYRRTCVPRATVLENINSNVEFYLRRGYSKEILSKYDVFICSKRTSHLYGRVVFPIYDDQRENAIGFVGRTLCPKCPQCKKYHLLTRPCPQFPYEFIAAEKWLNSKGFARNNTLFNYWFAKDFIRESGEAILVEGKGDVLKLEMADIHNSLGIFGTALTRAQADILRKSGAKKLYIATDSDDAGNIAAKAIEDELWDEFEIQRLNLESKDFGDMNVKEIKKFFANMEN